MSTSLKPAARTLVCGMSFFLLAAVPALAAEDAVGAEDLYRCRILGDNMECDRLPMPAEPDTVAQLVPGSYARYFMYLGDSQAQAIAKARLRGEEPTVRIVKRSATRVLSANEAHEKFLRGH